MEGLSPVQADAGLARGGTARQVRPSPLEASLPAGDMDVYVPQGDRFVHLHKIPCDDPTKVIEHDGVRYLTIASGGRQELLALDAEGEVQGRFAVPSGSRVQETALDGEHRRILLKTGDTLYSMEPGTCQPKSQRHVDPRSVSKLFARSDGTVLLVEGLRLQALGQEMGREIEVAHSVTPRHLQELPNQSLLLLDGSGYRSEVQVLDCEGRSVLEEHHVKRDSLRVDGEESLWLLASSPDGHGPDEVVHHFLTSGETTRFETTRDAGAVVPLPSGSFLIYDDRLAEPLLRLHSPEGSLSKQVAFESSSHLRQLLVTRDGQRAYVQIDRYPDGEPARRTLYGIDLHQDRDGGIGAGLRAAGRLVETLVQGRRAVAGQAIPLYERAGDRKDFTPAALADGRLLIFKEDGIDVLDASGHLQAHYDTPDALTSALGSLDVITRRIKVSLTTQDDLAEGLDACIADAKRKFQPRQAGTVPVEDERCLSFSHEVSRDEALGEMGLTAERYGSLLEQQALFGVTFDHVVELPWPDGGGARVQLQPDGLRVVEPSPVAGEEPTTSEFRLRAPETLVTVLPLQAGDRHFVAAASSEGYLYWFDPELASSERDVPRFCTGAPITSLALGPGNTVRAVGADGRISVYHPPVEPGAVLSGGSEGAEATEAGRSDSRVVVEPERVLIGGVAVTRRLSS